MTKKRLLVCVAVSIVMLLAVVGIDALMQKGEKPFQKIEIREASVKMLATQELFAISDVDALQAVLNDMVVYEKDDSWRQSNGINYVLMLVLTDGTQMEIREGGSFIAIDEIGYRAEYKSCEKLNDFVHSFVKTN